MSLKFSKKQRAEHAESILTDAMKVVRGEPIDEFWSNGPDDDREALTARWAEYRRVHGVGRKKDPEVL